MSWPISTWRIRRRSALVVLWLVCLAAAGSAQTRDRVTRVVDGDTVVLATLGTSRLIGVDTPETVDPRKQVQAFGREASAFTKTLLLNKAVRIERDQAATDKYGRALVYVYLADGRLANLEIIRAGFGHAYLQFPFSKMDEFRVAEREARSQQRGLWAAGAPATTDARTVFVAPTGTKYHTSDCRFVRDGKTAVRLDETPGHYTACAVCKPPKL
jgi:micrococcal nuclease